MTEVFKRLQREEWAKYKDKLKPFKYIKNKNGRIKGFYKDEDGVVYSHWLNDYEIKEYLKSHIEEGE